jgi:hypothetical protein
MRPNLANSPLQRVPPRSFRAVALLAIASAALPWTARANLVTNCSLRIAENERIGRVTAFCSHQRDLCCFQKWLAVLTDAATQVRIPIREFLLGVTQGTFARSFFE